LFAVIAAAFLRMAAAASFEGELVELAGGHDMSALVAWCENFELDLKHVGLALEASIAVYKVHLAAYLLCNQLDNARFLWKRMDPGPRDADPELCAIWTVGKVMWAKDHALTQSTITGFSWSPPLMGMLMERLQREHLQRCFNDTVRAYSLVSAASLSATLGVPVSTVQQMANAAGWTTDAESGAYVPCGGDEPKTKPALAETLSRLTDYVAHVEREIK